MLSRVRRTIAAVALGGWVLAGPGPPSYAQPDPRVAHTVAVETFRNVSGGADDAWIGDVIAEAMAADLGGQVGRVRDARWVVRGAYQRLGNRVRVTAELVDAVSGNRIDSVKIDGSFADLFGLQDALATAIATRLSAQTEGANILCVDRVEESAHETVRIIEDEDGVATPPDGRLAREPSGRRGPFGAWRVQRRGAGWRFPTSRSTGCRRSGRVPHRQ